MGSNFFFSSRVGYSLGVGKGICEGRNWASVSGNGTEWRYAGKKYIRLAYPPLFWAPTFVDRLGTVSLGNVWKIWKLMFKGHLVFYLFRNFFYLKTLITTFDNFDNLPYSTIEYSGWLYFFFFLWQLTLLLDHNGAERNRLIYKYKRFGASPLFTVCRPMSQMKNVACLYRAPLTFVGLAWWTDWTPNWRKRDEDFGNFYVNRGRRSRFC